MKKINPLLNLEEYLILLVTWMYDNLHAWNLKLNKNNWLVTRHDTEITRHFSKVEQAPPLSFDP